MTEPTNQNEPGGGGESHWADGLGDDYRGNETIRGYESMDDFAKAHLDLQGQVPTIPEGPDGYEFDLKDMKISDEARKEFSEWAHAVGMSKGQAQKALAMAYERNVKVAEAQKEQAEKAKQDADKAKADRKAATKKALQELWGHDNYDANSQKALKALEVLGPEGALDAFDKAGLSDDPIVMQVLFAAGSRLSEDDLVEGDRTKGGKNRRKPGDPPMLNFPSMDKE